MPALRSRKSAAILLGARPHGGPFTAWREESPERAGTGALGRARLPGDRAGAGGGSGGRSAAMRGVQQMAAEALKRPGGPSRSWEPAWGPSARGSGPPLLLLEPDSRGVSPWGGGHRGSAAE